MVEAATKTPGAKALVLGIVLSTAPVSAGDFICKWCVSCFG